MTAAAIPTTTATAATAPATHPAEDAEMIRLALAAGHITVPDPVTGFHRAMYAACPNDDQLAGIRQIVREHGRAITRVTMYCPRCANEFVAPTESLTLR